MTTEVTNDVTSESTQDHTFRGSTLLLRSGAVALASVLVMTAIAALVTGSAGAAGAAAGGGMALVVFLAGSLLVNAVAGVVPGLSLVFALSTYTLQVLVLGLFFSVLEQRDLVGGTLHAGWLGGTIIEVTVAWLAVQVLLSTRARIPVYDLPPRAGDR